jgi:hypothetical protein
MYSATSSLDTPARRKALRTVAIIANALPSLPDNSTVIFGYLGSVVMFVFVISTTLSVIRANNNPVDNLIVRAPLSKPNKDLRDSY